MFSSAAPMVPSADLVIPLWPVKGCFLHNLTHDRSMTDRSSLDFLVCPMLGRGVHMQF